VVPGRPPPSRVAPSIPRSGVGEVEPAAEREAGATSDVDEDDEVAGEPETQAGPDSEGQPGDLPAEYMDD
jgi:hypothetical protein